MDDKGNPPQQFRFRKKRGNTRLVEIYHRIVVEKAEHVCSHHRAHQQLPIEMESRANELEKLCNFRCVAIKVKEFTDIERIVYSRNFNFREQENVEKDMFTRASDNGKKGTR